MIYEKRYMIRCVSTWKKCCVPESVLRRRCVIYDMIGHMIGRVSVSIYLVHSSEAPGVASSSRSKSLGCKGTRARSLEGIYILS